MFKFYFLDVSLFGRVFLRIGLYIFIFVGDLEIDLVFGVQQIINNDLLDDKFKGVYKIYRMVQKVEKVKKDW